MNMEKEHEKMVRNGGALSLTVGIIVLVTGMVLGVLSIVNGAKLMAHSTDLIL